MSTKEAYSELPGNLFETVCAFLNRDGGVIVLGAHDDGTITDGVSRNIYKYVPLYTDKQPVIDDENVYTVKMALPTLMNAENSVRQEGVTETTQKTTETISALYMNGNKQKRIIRLCNRLILRTYDALQRSGHAPQRTAAEQKRAVKCGFMCETKKK